MASAGLQAAERKMRDSGLPDEAIATFGHYYEQLESGETGMLPEDSIEPVEDVADFDDLPEEDGPLDRAVVLKLNGGLGTSMGMTQAKSLIEAKDGLSFLDVLARQVLELRRSHGIYMAGSGRFNVVGLSDERVERFAAAVLEKMDG